jgi:hypothetical protein
MIDKYKPPQFMTSVELEEAIRAHRAYAKKLIAEARIRRREEKDASESQQSSEDLKPDSKK